MLRSAAGSPVAAAAARRIASVISRRRHSMRFERSNPRRQRPQLSGRTGACVARDAELDSQWNQLDSAVLALGRCNDCTNRRDDRLVGCKRVLELIAAAEASMKK